jgi:hypothetical protein
MFTIRQQKRVRGSGKSSGSVARERSSIEAASIEGASSLKRRKLVENQSTPPGASRRSVAFTSSAWSRCRSSAPRIFLLFEKVGGSSTARSYGPVSRARNSASARTHSCRPPGVQPQVLPAD